MREHFNVDEQAYLLVTICISIEGICFLVTSNQCPTNACSFDLFKGI